MTNKVEMKDVVNLCQNRGFVYPGSEIYGWLANSWDYGPYGSLLKENIKNLWLKEFVQKRIDTMLLDCSLIMNPKVWEASWHVGGFSDPLMDCKECKARWRADKLVDDKIEACENLKIPFLPIHGDMDLAVSISEGIQLSRWADVDLEIIKGAEHTFQTKQPWTDNELPYDMKKVVEKTISFFDNVEWFDLLF